MFTKLLKNQNDFLLFSNKTKVALLLLPFLILGVSNLQAQVSAYTLAQSTTAATPWTAGTYNTGILTPSPVAPNGLAYANVDDVVYSTVTLPFPFIYDGVSYPTGTIVYISSNGFVTLGSAPAVIEYNPISGTGAYSGAISVYGRNLAYLPTTTNRNIAYTSSATSLKIEWLAQRYLSGPSAIDTQTLVCQLWLNSDNSIDMWYNAFSPSGGLYTEQIGLRGTTNSDFKNLSYNPAIPANWPAALPLGTANTDVVMNRNTSGQIVGGATPSVKHFTWTPPGCFAPCTVNVSSITNNAATTTWNAVAPAETNGYDYYVTTSATAPTALTTPTGSVATGVLTANLSGLTGNSTYYIYVRSKKGACISAWSVVKNFTTLCDPYNLPYFNYFDVGGDTPSFSYAIPNIQSCHSIQNLNTTNNNVWKTTSNSPSLDPTGSFTDESLIYDPQTTTDAANVWFFTPGFNLVNGHTYKIAYVYGGSTNISTMVNKMLVRYGTSANDAGMMGGYLIADHNNIKSSYIESKISFTFTGTTGVYYFGFKAYSAATMGRIFLDNIEITEPGCKQPTGLAVSNVTGTSALATWTAPTPAPTLGYAYYLSTSSTAPTYDQVATGYVAAGTNSLNLTGLTGSTTYYIWVRSNCYLGDFSEWTPVVSFTTLFVPTYCTPSTATSTTYLNNFSTTGGVANINNPSGFSPSGYGNYISQFVSQAAGFSINFNTGIVGPTVGVAIWVDWNNDGFTTSDRMYNSGGYLTTCSGSFTVPAGQPIGDYRMRIVIDYNATSPSSCSFSAGLGEAEDYTFRVCPPPPPLTISSTSSTQCAGDNSPSVTITTPLSNFDNYSWSPTTGVTGTAATGYTFSSNSTITYTLTGVQTSAPFGSRTVTYTYTANQKPTPITITSSIEPVCQAGPATLLTASGGAVNGAIILNEDFNGGAPGWTNTNTSTGGTPSNPTWTIRPDAYNPAGSTSITTIHSNDATSFFLSNSDSQGLGSTTNTELISPTFAIPASYVTANVEFYHFLKTFIYTNNPYGKVMLSTDGGATYPITLQTFSPTTTGQVFPNSNSTDPGGKSSAINFIKSSYDLSGYIGQSNLRIKFQYFDLWGYIWAIDNFKVSGSATTAITWLPTTGLFTNAAATLPYTGTPTATVYAMPSATTIYTASASTPVAPICTTTKDITVTVKPIVAGVAATTLGSCGISDIALTGTTGTVTGWEYSTTNTPFTAVAIPSSAVTTLTTALIGSFTGTRYFRAVVTNNGCTAYSNVITESNNPTIWDGTTWSLGAPTSSVPAIMNGNYTSSGNLNACSVTVNSGTVVINSGDTWTIQNEVNVVGGTVTFNNTASLVQVNNSVNTGNIIYNRTTTPMTIYDYTYWSTPVVGMNLLSVSPLTPINRFWYYDAAITNNWTYASTASAMVPAEGYIIRAPAGWSSTVAATYNATFTGVPNNGTITIPITGGAVSNLIGNPYPSAIDANLFLGDASNTGVVNGTVYLWTHNTPANNGQYTASDYATYNLTGGTGTAATNSGINNTIPTGKIAACQSFFIDGVSNGNATFKNTMRVAANNTQFYKNNNATVSDRSRLWLEMSNNQDAFKQILVGYVPTATNAMDRDFDGISYDGGTSISLYSLVDTNQLTIQGRALPFDQYDIVPLGYSSSLTGDFSIRLADFDGLFTNQNIYIEDKLLGIVHNLKDSDYTFSTNTGTFNDRFNLKYINNLTANTAVFNNESVVVYKQNQAINIRTSNTIMDEVKITDIRGSLLFDKKGINATEFSIANLASSEQLLLITISSKDGKVINKKLIF